jgi:hypothetical protein
VELVNEPDQTASQSGTLNDGGERAVEKEVTPLEHRTEACGNDNAAMRRTDPEVLHTGDCHRSPSDTNVGRRVDALFLFPQSFNSAIEGNSDRAAAASMDAYRTHALKGPEGRLLYPSALGTSTRCAAA